MLDPVTYQPRYTAPARPTAESDAGAYREAELMFPDSEADAAARASTEARCSEIISKLPIWAQKALNDPISDPETYKMAKDLFDGEYNRVLEQNKDYTRTVQKQKRLTAAARAIGV